MSTLNYITYTLRTGQHRVLIIMCAYFSESSVYVKLKHRNKYRGAGKSLARPERKQATATEDFDVHISYLLTQLEEY